MTVTKFLKKIHMYGTWKKICIFLVNKIFVGTKKVPCMVKRKLLKTIECEIGKNTTVVGPIFPMGKLKVGKNCWIGRNFTVNGSGSVTIGDDCDIAPDVSFVTGSHQIGERQRRAGKGESYSICVGDGVWIGARATISKNVMVGSGSIIAMCACVVKDVDEDTIVGGVPATLIRRL